MAKIEHNILYFFAPKFSKIFAAKKENNMLKIIHCWNFTTKMAVFMLNFREKRLYTLSFTVKYAGNFWGINLQHILL